MSETLDARLERAIKKRDELAASRQRIVGRLEAAQAALAAVEEECRAKGVDPSKIDSTLEALEARYRTQVQDLETQVAAAEQAITPFLEAISAARHGSSGP